MFNIGVEFQDELDKGTISAALQAEFSKHGISLSQYKTITIEQSGKRWVIIDEGGAYTVNKEYNVLNVYDAFSAKYSGWRNWEQPFVEWAERAGYKMEYAVNSDLEFHPENLKHYRLVLSVGHDEYWSSPMRDHLEAFIAGGGNVAFFSGNSVCWQVRSEDNGRSLVGWKEAYKQDPYYESGDHKLLTTLWCSRLINRPENQLTGVSFAYGGYHRFLISFRTVGEPTRSIDQTTGSSKGQG